MTDPYGILGVRPDCSDAELAKAYKRLAKRYHPDLNPGDADAAARMGQINQAYDEIKRLRQSGGRGAYRAASGGASTAREPYYAAYRRGSSPDYSDEFDYHRPASPFRVAVIIMVTVLLLQLFSAVLGGTTPAQRFRERFAASGEPQPYYYNVFTHLYP